MYVTGPGPRRARPRRQRLPRGHVQRALPADLRGRGRDARLFRQFSFPGGIPSHVAPETPGSIHEGGELGYALSHAFGAAFDNPDLLVACVVGDGEAETGPLATSWHSNKFLESARPTARSSRSSTSTATRSRTRRSWRASPSAELESLMRGYGWEPHWSRATTRSRCTRTSPRTLDAVLDEIAEIQHAAREEGERGRPRGRCSSCARRRAGPGRARSTASPWRARGARIRCRWPRRARTRATAACSRSGCAATGPRSCSTSTGRSSPELRALAPEGDAAHGREPARERRRCCCGTSSCPTSATTPSPVDQPGTTFSEATRVLGAFLRDVIAAERDDLPHLRPRRDRVEPARRRVRGDRPRSGTRDARRPTSISRPTAA